MDKTPVRLLTGALALGWLFDFLFWRRSLGVNYILFLIALTAAAYPLLRASGIRPARTSLPLLIPAAFFGALVFIRREPLTLFLAFSISALTLVHYFITYRGGRWLRFGIKDLVYRYAGLGMSLLFGPLDLLPRIFEFMRTSRSLRGRFPVFPLLRGLLFSIPIVIVLGSLLVSADVVFHQQVYEFGQRFRIDNLGEYLFRLLLILVTGFLIASLFLNVEKSDPSSPLLGEDKPTISPFLGFVETSTILSSVIVLFTLFVAVQFRYFFGGEANIGVEGFTYSQYARRGFNEILVVATISLLLIVGLSNLSRRNSESQRRIFSGLTAALGVLVLVMLVSAYFRLELAIQWHGFSRLRFYPRIFLFWLGLLIVAVVLLEFTRRPRYFTSAALLAALGFAFSIGLLNVDASIVHYNVFRARQGKHFNVTHLAMLSIDAVPALAEEFRDPDLPVSIREGVGAALFCHLERTKAAPVLDWRSFNLVEWEVEQVRAEFGAAFDSYQFMEQAFPNRVRTPGGVEYQCWAPEGEY